MNPGGSLSKIWLGGFAAMLLLGMAPLAQAACTTDPATPFSNNAAIECVTFDDGAAHGGNVTNLTAGQIMTTSTSPPASYGIGVVNPSTTLNGSIVNQGSITAYGAAIGLDNRATVAGDLINNGGISVSPGFGILVVAGSSLQASASGSGSIINNGLIDVTGPGGTGIIAQGAAIAGSIVNNGTINHTGVGTGVTISFGTTMAGSVINNGTITGGGTGISLAGGLSSPSSSFVSVAGSVVNNGTITGGVHGIFVNDASVLGSVVNNGAITADYGITVLARSASPGPSAITNTGTITSGFAAIDLSSAVLGPPTTIDQQGGAITGDILLSPLGNTVNITGGTITGNIVGNSATNGDNAGTVNFALGSSSFTTGGTIDVANVNVDSGTVVLANDVTVFNALTNNATLRLNNTGTRRIIGNYIQSSAGTLAMEISPTGAAQLSVTRNAVLAGKLALLYDPGTYTARSFTLLQANSISGTFSQATGTIPTPGMGQLLSITPTTVQLELTNSPTPGPVIIVAPSNDAIYSATASRLVQTGQMVNAIVLDRLAARLGGDGRPLVAEATPPGMPVQLAQLGGGNVAAMGELAEVLPRAATEQGGWFRGIGDFASVTGNGSAPGFNAESGGFMAGFDRELSPGLFAGVAGGYTHSNLQQTATSGAIDTGRLFAYGGGRLGRAYWGAAAGYAHDWIATDRQVSGIGTASEDHGANEVSFGGEAGLPVRLGDAVVTPRAGANFLHVEEESFVETGAGGANLSGTSGSMNSVQPFIGMALSQRFRTEGGTGITPELRLGYSHELADNTRLLTVTAIDGTSFLTPGVRPSRDMLRAGTGITVRARDDLAFFVDYDAILPTGNTVEQSISAGLRVEF
jgi:fibronectin-binding autotransporter adhesin